MGGPVFFLFSVMGAVPVDPPDTSDDNSRIDRQLFNIYGY